MCKAMHLYNSLLPYSRLIPDLKLFFKNTQRSSPCMGLALGRLHFLAMFSSHIIEPSRKSTDKMTNHD